MTKTMIQRSAFLAVLPLMVAMVGCGGGGGGTSRAKVAVYAADSFRDDYSQVWATIYKVELLDASGAAVTVYEDAAGKVLDLASLRDASGPRFAFLGANAVPAGSYVKVRVTTAPTLELFPKGSTTGTAVTVAASVPRDPSGNAVVTVPLRGARRLGETDDDVVVDFDLANFALSGGKLIPSLLEGERTGLRDKGRHESEDYHGIVSGLSGTAPVQTFTLQRGIFSATVTTSADTVIFQRGTGGLSLAEGQRVEVRGVFDATTRQLVATEIRIKDGTNDDYHRHEVKGAPSAIDATAGTFVVSALKTEGFRPDRRDVTVKTDGTTVFRGDRGAVLSASAFFTALATSPFVEAEGVYDPATATLTAKRVKLEDSRPGGEHGHGHGGDDEGDDEGDDD